MAQCMEFPYTNIKKNRKNGPVLVCFSHMEFPVGAGLFGDFGGCHDATPR